MEGQIVSFRRSRRVVSGSQIIVNAATIDSRIKAESLIGKKVVWETPAKKVVSGKVSGTHGRNGSMKVLFEQGMPGQSIGNKVKIE